jgi:hypothetical protein
VVVAFTQVHAVLEPHQLVHAAGFAYAASWVMSQLPVLGLAMVRVRVVALAPRNTLWMVGAAQLQSMRGKVKSGE